MSTLSNLTIGGAPVAAAAAPADALPAPIVAAPVSNGVTVLDAKSATVVDALGRAIKVQRLSALQKMRLARFCGAENDRFVGYATLASSVIEIEGQPAPPPSTILQIEAMVSRLDDEGLAAVGRALMAVTPGMGIDQEAAENL
jgi:hypothetical protein